MKMTKEERKALKHTDPDRVPFGKILGFQTRGISVGAVVLIVSTYLSLYCTDTLKMPPILVGTLLMCSKIFDGFTDLFAGYIVDNTKTRWGKGRPYEFCILGCWICTYALFSIPKAWSLTGKAIWLFLMYTMISSVFQTLLGAAEAPYMIRAFHTPQAIAKVGAYGGIIITIGCMIVSTSFPIFVDRIAVNAAGWSKLVLMYAVPLAAIGILRFILIKEEPTEEEMKASSGEKVSLKQIITMFRTNKYVWIFAVACMIPQSISGMAAGPYYFKQVVGNLGSYSIIQMLSLVMMIFMFILPRLMKKYTVMQIMGGTSVIGICGYVLAFFAHKNIPLLAVSTVIFGISMLPAAYLRMPIVMQVADYNSMKQFPRMEATISSAATFLNKLGNAVGSFLMGMLLNFGGYNSEAVVQTDSAIMMIRFSYSLIPAVLMIIPVICAIMFRPLDQMTKSAG